MKIGIIGGGKWGSALHFAIKDHKPLLYSRKNTQNSLQEVLECEYLIFALPAQVADAWMSENFINKNQKILIAAKGIDVRECKFLNDIFAKYTKKEYLAYLTGPSFASEVMQSLPCAIVINSINKTLSEEFKAFFPNFMKTYTSDDIVGAEICGSYKNVIAIAGGICEGLNLGNNARAALIARGLIEMQRFGRFYGAKDETFLGLSGAGDLFLTATSKLSRNFRVGLALANGDGLDKILNDLSEVAEGVYTAQAIQKMAKSNNIYTPIATEVFNVLNGKNPRSSLSDLLED